MLKITEQQYGNVVPLSKCGGDSFSSQEEQGGKLTDRAVYVGRGYLYFMKPLEFASAESY